MSTFISSIFGRKSAAPAPITTQKSSGPSHSTASVAARAAIPTHAPSSTKLTASTTIAAPSARIVAPAPKSPSREIVEALVKYQIITTDPNKLEGMFVANNGMEYMAYNRAEQKIELKNPRALALIADLVKDLGIKTVSGNALDQHIGRSPNWDEHDFDLSLRGFALIIMDDGVKFV
jgi:hypothetical protein